MPDGMSFSTAILPGIAAIVVGAVLTARFLRDLYFALGSRRWSRATGRFLTSSAELGVEGSGSPTYEYDVDGRTIMSSRFDFAGRGIGDGARLRPFEPGDAVEVWYDPRRPERSVLAPGASSGNVGRLLAGASLVAVGQFMLRVASIDPAAAAADPRLTSPVEIAEERAQAPVADTLIVAPSRLTLRVGQRFPIAVGMRVIALNADGGEVRDFEPSFNLVPSPMVRVTDAVLEAVEPGDAVLYVEGAPRGFGENVARRPSTRVEIVVER